MSHDAETGSFTILLAVIIILVVYARMSDAITEVRRYFGLGSVNDEDISIWIDEDEGIRKGSVFDDETLWNNDWKDSIVEIKDGK